MSVPKTRPDASKDARTNDAHASRPLTFTDNVVLMLKLLAGAGVLGAALWAADLWTAAG